MRRSIRLRLIVWMLAALVPLAAGAGWLLLQLFGNRLLHDVDVALEEEAETVAALISTGAGASAVQGLAGQIATETDTGPRKYVTITRGGRVLSEFPPGADAMIRSGDPELRIRHYEAPTSDGPVTVAVAVSAAAAMHAERRLTSLLAIGIPALVLLLGATLWAIIGRALRPLESAARRLDSIAADTLSVRVPVEDPDDEVGRMVTVLNRMLDRLQSAVSALQRFTADAAHELRTPLTVLRTGLEVALARERPADEYRAALTEALGGTDRMCRLADDLLTLARLEAAGAPHAATVVDLSEVLHELADASGEAAAQRRVTLRVAAAPDLRVQGNPGDLYRLFNNLIENALRHSDAGAPIDLSAERRAQTVLVTVADRGGGIPPAELPHVFDRFYRGHGEQPDRTGAGLGLSIAQEIARTHGGHLSAANRDGGGCVMTVTLPVAS